MMNNKIYRYPQQQQMKGGDSASRSAPPLQVSQGQGRGLLSNPGPISDLVYRFPKGQQPNLGSMTGGLAQGLAQKGAIQNGLGQSMPQGQIQAWGGGQGYGVPGQAKGLPQAPTQLDEYNSKIAAAGQGRMQAMNSAMGSMAQGQMPMTGGPVYNQPQMSDPTIGNGQQMGNNMGMSAGQPAAMPRQDRDPNQVAARQAQRQAYLQRMGRA